MTGTRAPPWNAPARAWRWWKAPRTAGWRWTGRSPPLAGAGVTSVLVEGGAVLHTELIRQGLFDKLVVVVAPIVIGSGIEAVGDLETLAWSTPCAWNASATGRSTTR